ncbi:citramalate synthase [Paraburkholderia bengalensis]|uniref:Citramalate synthase n=1 Tax=Paraburkholderia bengalensis TaxID=2747562 RepID=A0ABU8IJF8_9BURK
MSSLPHSGESPRERLEYRGYHVSVYATRNDRDNWRAVIEVERDGHPVQLEETEDVGPFWQTREEAQRAGLERARYLLDRRDGVLDLRNPARPT